MNIFVLDRNPVIAAEMLCDKHVVKMLLETAQILCTVAHRYGIGAPYKPTHANHPCVLWAGDTGANFLWTYHHGIALVLEYIHRYGKQHKSADVITGIGQTVTLATIAPLNPLTPFAQCMPEQYRGPDAVDAYRRYYRAEKASFAKWQRGRSMPEWMADC